MSGALTRFARRWWSGAYGPVGRLLGLLLLPLSWLWRGVTAVRNRRWDARGGAATDGAVVVSVGNLAVGGTGKTPFSAWVAACLASTEGTRPALLLSGYGIDEVLLHRSWNPDVPVVAGRDRVDGARRAARDGATVIVLDDGFQHRRLARDLDIVLLALDDPFPGGVLPVGPYREPARSLARADAIVLTRRSASLEAAHALAERVAATPGVRDGAVLGCVRLSADVLEPLVSGPGGRREGVAAPAGRLTSGAVALTAVARPEAFRRDVAALASDSVDLVAYADHHDFTDDDVRRARSRAGNRPIVVTEKDAVKLRRLAAPPDEVWVLRERLLWDWGEEDVRTLLHETVRRAAESAA